MRWCMDPEEPECNGPECGHAETCQFYIDCMKEDPCYSEYLKKWKEKHDRGR